MCCICEGGIVVSDARIGGPLDEGPSPEVVDCVELGKGRVRAGGPHSLDKGKGAFPEVACWLIEQPPIIRQWVAQTRRVHFLLTRPFLQPTTEHNLPSPSPPEKNPEVYVWFAEPPELPDGYDT
jgi:hypothetical protein